MKTKNKSPKKGPPFEPGKEVPVKPDPNPDPTRIEEPKKNDPTRIEPDPLKPVTPVKPDPAKPVTPEKPSTPPSDGK